MSPKMVPCGAPIPLESLTLGDRPTEYVYNAATSLMRAPDSDSMPSTPGSCVLELSVRPCQSVAAALRIPAIEPPPGPIAAAFRVRAASPPAPAPAHASRFAPSTAAMKAFAGDLVPYMLCEYELNGLAITARPLPPDLPPRVADTFNHSRGPIPPAAAALAVPLMQRTRPALAGLPPKQVHVEARPAAEVANLAATARLKDGAEHVTLHELMYDDAFAASMLNWQLQPSKQLSELLEWLLTELAARHARGAPHGAVSLHSLAYAPGSARWLLVPPPPPLAGAPAADPADAPAADLVATARLACFMSAPPDARRDVQPHHVPGLSDARLLELAAHAPAIRVLAAALLERRATLADALAFHAWHPLVVHAQVLQDTKAVMRSMRLGGEDFDALYGTLVLGGASWREALGSALVPEIVRASREHVMRAEFAAYDYRSAASLLRFAANTVGHFEELGLGLTLSRAAFLGAVLAAFPGLVPACYHYLSTYPALHVHNRDSDLVFGAIEANIDMVHKRMHAALDGYAGGHVWRLTDVPAFSEAGAVAAAPGAADGKAAALAERWATWRCDAGGGCDGLADGSCVKWHDGRELRFAQAHLCESFLGGGCTRSACPNAHGFSEIRAALNDSSPICWRWLEGRCRMPHCKYAHTFRRCHGPPSARASHDNGHRAAGGHSARASLDDPSAASRRASFGHSRESMDLDGPVHGRAIALESALTAPSKLRPAPAPWHAPKGSGRNSGSLDHQRRRGSGSFDQKRPPRSFESHSGGANGERGGAAPATSLSHVRNGFSTPDRRRSSIGGAVAPASGTWRRSCDKPAAAAERPPVLRDSDVGA